LSKIKSAIDRNTIGVLAINILGDPCGDLPSIKEFCKDEGMWLLEDNCESLGAEIGGKQCGTFGDIGTFSFFFSHHISTMEGGMVVTDNEEVAHIAMELRAHGWTRDLPKDSPIYQKPENWRYENYDFALPGFNLRPLEIEAAVGREQLKNLDRFVAQRRKNAAVFVKLFGGDERFIIQRENGKSSWFDFSVILNPKYKIDREKVWDGLKAAGIEFRPITGGNFAQHRAARHYDYEIFEGLPNATLANDNGFFVGNFHYDIADKIEYFHNVLTKLAGR
jgi:CDP-6-deoxy-D-xylo-4-hexulose-3-dehydrase